MLNNIITEWKTRVGLIENTIFEKMIGKFIEPTDERSTHIYFIYGMGDKCLLALAIELYETTTKIRTSTISFDNLIDYIDIDTTIAIEKFPKHLHRLFKIVLESTK